MALPTAQGTLFPNDASFDLGELLKIVQLNGIDPMWAEVDTFDALVEKVGNVDWGQEIRWALNVDPGGGSVARMSQESGRFAPGDRTRNLLGKIYPKLQTITYQFERFMKKLSGSQAAAYIENAKQEFMMKNMFHKSFMALQMLGDGTGRHAEPIAFGASDTTSGASFTAADLNTPLKVKLSASDSAAGSVSHLMEGMVVSFVFEDTSNVARLLALSAIDAGATATVVYDAFRVVEVDVVDNAIYVLPGRAGTTVAAIGSYTQDNFWVDAAATGAITFTPIKGIRPEYPSTDAEFGNPPGGAAAAATAIEDALNLRMALMHPLYVPESQTNALLALGKGWASDTDLSLINDGVLTGLEAHITNKTNTVHNINRQSVRQYLATVKDNKGRDLTFNTLYAFLAEHAARNRARNQQASWTGVLMHTLVYSSMVSLSELDRRITEGKGMRGEEGAKMVKFENKTYQLDSHTSMRLDRVHAIPKGGIKLYDGKLEPVEVNGQSQFLTLADGKRINVIEAHSTLTGEACVFMPRDFGVIRNFKFSKY